MNIGYRNHNFTRPWLFILHYENVLSGGITLRLRMTSGPSVYALHLLHRYFDLVAAKFNVTALLQLPRDCHGDGRPR